MSAARAQAALALLGERLGLKGLRLDDSGACQLMFEQRWLVTLVHDAALRRIVLHCPLCTAPQAATLSLATLRALLQANFMGQGCGGGQLALAPDGQIGLQSAVALSDADEALAPALETLLDQAERWSPRLQAGDPEPSQADAVAALSAWAMQKV